MTKRKEERRELLKEDEFLTILERAAEYIQKEPRAVAIYCGAALLALASIFGVFAYLENAREQRAKALYDAERVLYTDLDDANADFQFETETEKLEKALEKLDEVIGGQGGLVKTQAQFHKIGVLVALGRQDQAEAIYKDIIAAKDRFQFLALNGLADYYLEKGEYEAALEQCNQLSSISGEVGNFEDFAQFKMARCYQKMGKDQEAKDKLTSLMAKYDGQPDQPPILARAKTLLEEIDRDLAAVSGSTGNS